MILYCTIVLGVLVVIHEGGHYLVARAFGVRVSEFMVGLPGPNVGFKWHGTKFGVTAVPLGGYARVCGMEPGEESPHLEGALASVYARGTAVMEDVARDLGVSDDEAMEALDELVEWGSITGPKRHDEFNTYRTPEQGKRGSQGYCEEGSARPLQDPHAFFESERAQQYRSLPFWKRCLILLAGPGMNLLFTVLVIVVVYSVIGVDIQDASGQTTHFTASPLMSLWAGINYIGMVFMAILGLFNPATAAETVSNSTSIVGIAVMSKDAAEAGMLDFAMFSAMISVSLGLMNLLPIPPLDGGRLLVEVIQKIRRREVTLRTLNTVSVVGVTLFMLFFLFMLNQDVQRFVLGNW